MLTDTAEILLVEDDEDHAELICCGFASRAEFAPLTRARNLHEARSRLAESIPDLVIADLRLPDGSGIELLPKEKEHARFPVVIMTAQGDEAAAVEAMKAGALDYIVKSPATVSDMPYVAERALREWQHVIGHRRAEQKFQAVLEFAPDAMVITNADGKVVLLNAQTELLFGHRRDDLLGQPVEILLPERLRKAFRDHRERLIAELAAQLPDGSSNRCELPGDETVFAVAHPLSEQGSPAEYTSVRKDGSTFPVEVTVRAIRFDGVPGLLYVLRDIGDRKRAEEQAQQLREELAHVTRLSTMGEMATALAHELNQPMSAIAAYSSACLKLLQSTPQTPETARLVEILEKVNAQALRAGKIIRGLRKFVTKREPKHTRSCMNDAVRETVALLESEAKEQGVRIDLRLTDGLSLVLADIILIQQVIVNLVRNGIEAMAGQQQERTLSVSTSMPAAGTVEVAVCDTGSGLPPQDLERVFDQFFSTKPNGLGIGLSISRSIIDAHRGRLWLMPNVDRGLTFRFTLPAAKGSE